VHRVFRLFARLLTLAIVLGIPAVLAYLQFVGFDASWRGKVAEALSGPTHRVSIERLTFDVFSGVVAEGVNVFQRGDPGRQIAGVDQLVVSLNLADLLRGRFTIDRLVLDNAELSIPFADDGKEPDSIQLRELDADVTNSGGQLSINRAECWFRGIHLSLRGHLLYPEGSARPAPASENVEERVAAIRRFLEVFDEIEFSPPAPQLVVELAGDIADPATISAPSISFTTGGVRFREIAFDELNVQAVYANRKLRLRSAKLSGKSGSLQVFGDWDFASRRGNLDIIGKTVVAPLLRLTGRSDLADEIHFDSPPEIDLSVKISPEAPRVFVMGQVATRAFALKGIEARSFSADFAWKDGDMFVQNAHLVAQTGEIRMSALMLPAEFRVKLDSDAKPTEFKGLFGPKERELLDVMEFDDAPKVSLSLQGEQPKFEELQGSGHIALGRTAMRGSWIDSGESAVAFKDRAVRYENFVLRKNGGTATGSFVYDFGRREVRIEKVKSSLDPVSVLMWIDPRIAETVSVYRFNRPPNVQVDGLVHMKDPDLNDLDIEVSAPGGLKYELIKKDLPFGRTEATVRLKGQRVLANVRRADLFGGQAAIDARVSTKPDDPSFGASVTVRNVDFASLTDLYFGYSKSRGKMSGNYDFTASLRDPAAMKGKGSIRVEEGHVLSIPLFGPLSDIISTIIPGVGHESARLATADFTIANHRVYTNDLKIEGQGFELFGDGSVGFPKGDLDLTVRINARGIPGIVLFPVSKLFEYVSTGTVSNPQWRPKIVPREFFEVLGLQQDAGGSPPERARERDRRPAGRR